MRKLVPMRPACHMAQVEVLVHVVSALFDINPSMSSHMAPPLWKRCVGVLFEVLALLRANPHITMDEHYEGGADEGCGSPRSSISISGHLSSHKRIHLYHLYLHFTESCCAVVRLRLAALGR